MADVKQFSKKPVQFVSHPLYDNFGDIIGKPAARKKLGLDENDFIILFFGFIRKYKGLDILLDAIPAVVKINTQYKIFDSRRILRRQKTL